MRSRRPSLACLYLLPSLPRALQGKVAAPLLAQTVTGGHAGRKSFLGLMLDARELAAVRSSLQEARMLGRGGLTGEGKEREGRPTFSHRDVRARPGWEKAPAT